MQIGKSNYFFLIPQDRSREPVVHISSVRSVLRGLGIQKVDKLSLVFLKGPTKIFSYRQG